MYQRANMLNPTHAIYGKIITKEYSQVQDSIAPNSKRDAENSTR